MKIVIAEPCHQKWEKMMPTASGAFCSHCVKEVVDFTKMSDEEVMNFLITKKEEQICGRFKSNVVQNPTIAISEDIFYKRIAGWKKLMAIMLIAFGNMLIGCDVQHTTGNVVPIQYIDSVANVDNDTINTLPTISDTTHPAPKIIPPVPKEVIPPETFITGEPAVIMGTPKKNDVDTVLNSSLNDSIIVDHE